MRAASFFKFWAFVSALTLDMILVVLAGIVSLAPLVLPPVLQKQITNQLVSAGFPKAVIHLHHLGLSEAQAELILDPDHGPFFPNVKIGYSPLSLIQAQVEKITLQNVAVTLDVDKKGNVFIPGQTLKEQGPPAPLVIPILPFRILRLDHAQVTVNSPQGIITSVANIQLNQKEALIWNISGSGEISHNWGHVSADLDGQIEAEGAAQLNITLKEGRVSLPYGQAEGLTGTLKAQLDPGQKTIVADGHVNMDKAVPAMAPIQAQGLVLDFHYDSQEKTPLTADLTINQMEVTSTPAYTAPGRLHGHIEGDPTALLTFKSTLDIAMESIVLTAEGQHNVVSGEGKTKIVLGETTLGEFASLPALSPWLANRIDTLTGTFQGHVTMTWNTKGLKGQAVLGLNKVTAAKDTVKIENLSTSLNISSLIPLSTAANQTVMADSLQVGIPLEHPKLVFQWRSNNMLDVKEASIQWSGGELHIESFHTSLTKPGFSSALVMKNIQLGQVLKLAGVNGLQAIGTVNGRIPIRLEGDTIHLEGGLLNAVGKGTLKYNPAEPPPYLQGEAAAGGTNILMEALTDFRYESLSATIDGIVGQDLTIGLKIKGANPSFYDGYPVALNLNLSGALDTIVRHSLETFQIPEVLQNQLKEQQGH